MIASCLSSTNILSQCNCPGEHAIAPDSTIRVHASQVGYNRDKYIDLDIRDGFVIKEGDIIVATLEDFKNKTVAFDHGFWPNNTMPYVIGSGFNASDIAEIHGAAAHITSNTNLTVKVRTTETQWVAISTGTGCGASIGMPETGNASISLATGCSLGNTIHEFLHTAGVQHEQVREDRNAFVNINFSNIEAGKEHNFFISDSKTNTDYGAYDYGSIMHYGAFFFAINPNIPTITTIPAGIPIGQRDGMSATDIASVNKMYPVCSSTNITVTGNLNGRRTATADITCTADVYDKKIGILSSSTKVRLLPGAHFKSGSKGKVSHEGCNPDNDWGN
jgi:hypothetical protein